MKHIVPIPFRDEIFVVEAQHVKSLFGLPVVYLSVPGERISLTTETAIMLGEALLAAAGGTLTEDTPRNVKR